MNNPLCIVDVFAEKKYQGNQLAVINCREALTDEAMQLIANEMHFSETTFILSEKQRDGGYDVRIFTPSEEVPFAGHPTLGTAFVIQQKIIKKPVEKINLNLKVGQIEVSFQYQGKRPEILWMKQINPIFMRDFKPDSFASVMCLERKEIDDRFPIQVVSTGLPFVIVPLKTLAYLKTIEAMKDRYLALIDRTDIQGVFFFCPETYDPANQVHARMFTCFHEMVEDPATGSANGCLAGYLVKHRYFARNDVDVKVEQGHEVARPSLLYLRAHAEGEKIHVHVGGKVVLMAEGKLV